MAKQENNHPWKLGLRTVRNILSARTKQGVQSVPSSFKLHVGGSQKIQGRKSCQALAYGRKSRAAATSRLSHALSGRVCRSAFGRWSLQGRERLATIVMDCHLFSAIYAAGNIAVGHIGPPPDDRHDLVVFDDPQVAQIQRPPTPGTSELAILT